MSEFGNDVTNFCRVCNARNATVSEPPEPLAHELGQIAFDAYGASVGGVTWDGKPIPGWLEVTETVREGWRDAALAVACVCSMAFGESHQQALDRALAVNLGKTERRKG